MILKKGTKTFKSTLTSLSIVSFAFLSLLLMAGINTVKAQAITEGFDDITTLPTKGWVLTNRSQPLGTTGWFQGNPTTFPAQSGATNSYIGANFNNTTGATGVISNWLITPNRTFSNGDTISFYTRIPDSATEFPDRLEVRLSTNGASTDVGTTATSVGDFTTLLLSINPNLQTGVYPKAWTQFTITISGLAAPTSGRIAFRYFVTGAGPSGDNSNYIGIDTFQYTPTTGGGTANALADFNGDGRTDFAVTRATSATTEMTWFIKNNVAAGNGAETFRQFGTGFGFWRYTNTAGDAAVPEDFDGDGKDDIAVWRAGNPFEAAFYILQSATNTLRIEQFGQTGDNPTVVGDWDGDGKADPAVWRRGATAGSQSFYYYRGSLNNPSRGTTYLPWGVREDFATAADYDGDGKFDASVYRLGSPTTAQGTFITRLSQTNTIQYAGFGTGTFNLLDRAGAPRGDYDGDGKADYALVRAEGANLNWFIRNSSTGTITYRTFGASATDFAAPGDYDGDGKSDVAIYRTGAGADMTFYLWQRSSDGALGYQEWGSSTAALNLPDFAVQLNFVH